MIKYYKNYLLTSSKSYIKFDNNISTVDYLIKK